MEYKWMPIMGKMIREDDALVFKGKTIKFKDSEGKQITGGAMGLFICDQTFTGGAITGDIMFTGISEQSCCDLVLYFDPQTKYTVNAGIGYESLFSIRYFDAKWSYLASAGEKGTLEKSRVYRVTARLQGSVVSLSVDDVEVLRTNLSFPLPQSQVGAFCIDRHDIRITNFSVKPERPKAFVVMEFGSPFNEVYSEVIKTICNELKLDVLRIDEKTGPGIIIADINKAILEAKLVIADISPNNPNVFYEVGYAHAFKKPTILIAEEERELPFDVSPFRTLFYRNSIAGKRKLEEGLRKHITAILNEPTR